MHKRHLLIVSAFAALTTLFTSCKDGDWETSPTGLKHQFLKNEEGENIQVGDVVQMHVKYSTSKDSVLFNSFTTPQPITMEVPASQFKGSFEEAVCLLSEGDSAKFLIAADSIFRKEYGAVRPAFIDSGSYLTFVVKVLKKEKKEAYASRMEKEKAERSGKQKAIDKELIEKYVAEKGLKTNVTESGIHIQIVKEGKGTVPVTGDTVGVQYTGRTLDGKVFDSSRKEDGGMGSPFDFVLGVTPIIQGWQEGVAKLKQGDRATLIIPSTLAYGEQSTPRFGPNSVLTFDVEIVKVIKPKK